MAFEIPGKSIPVEASADLSAAQFRVMTINSSGQLVQAGVGDPIAGVLQDGPAAAGRAGQLMLDGVTKVEAGGVVAAGATVKSDASGRAISTAAVTTQWNLGIALEGAGGAGELIAVLMNPHQAL